MVIVLIKTTDLKYIPIDNVQNEAMRETIYPTADVKEISQ